MTFNFDGDLMGYEYDIPLSVAKSYFRKFTHEELFDVIKDYYLEDPEVRENFKGEIFIFNVEIFIFNDEIIFSNGEIIILSAIRRYIVSLARS